MFDTAVSHLLNSIWSKDLQDRAQGLHVGFRAMIGMCLIFPVCSLLPYDEFDTGHEWKPCYEIIDKRA